MQGFNSALPEGALLTFNHYMKEDMVGK